MEHHAIAWETVAVVRGARDFELTVELDALPSPDWEVLFNQASEQWGLSVEGRGWSSIRMQDGTISMRDLQPEAREQARNHLEDVVVRTNAALAAKREEEEKERLRREQEEADQRRTADELTEWFRSGAAPARPAAGTPAEPAPSPQTAASEQADLRDRLVHAFRTDVA